jgi:hypothetical protein
MTPIAAAGETPRKVIRVFLRFPQPIAALESPRRTTSGVMAAPATAPNGPRLRLLAEATGYGTRPPGRTRDTRT